MKKIGILITIFMMSFLLACNGFTLSTNSTTTSEESTTAITDITSGTTTGSTVPVFTGNVPVYQGMTLSSENVLLSYNPEIMGYTLLNIGFRYPNFFEQSDTTTTILTTETTVGIIDDEQIDYFSQTNVDLFLTVYLSNPDRYEILSFTLNGYKYQSYQFEDGSNSEELILKVNSGNVEGIKEFTIDQIKYVNGTLINDVIIYGDRTIKLGVTYTEFPYAEIEDIIIGINDFETEINITDNNNLLEQVDAYAKFVIYDENDDLIYEELLDEGNNLISFDGLFSNTVYTYGVLAYYDIYSGEGMSSTYMITGEFTTNSFMTIKDVIPDYDSVTFDVEIAESDITGNLVMIELYQEDEFIMELTDVDLRMFEGLLANNTYTIQMTYEYDLNDLGLQRETMTYDFTTLAYLAPSVHIENIIPLQESVTFEIDFDDPDMVGIITKIELFEPDVLVEELSDTSLREFTDLLSNHTYILRVTYTYDLKDGLGVFSQFVVKEFNTLAKGIPVVNVENVIPTQDSITFGINVIDEDKVGDITGIELYHEGELVESLVDLSSREFVGLLSNSSYEIHVLYTYDLNDGLGEQTLTIIYNKIKDSYDQIDIVDIGHDITFVAETEPTYEFIEDATVFYYSLGNQMILNDGIHEPLIMMQRYLEGGKMYSLTVTMKNSIEAPVAFAMWGDSSGFISLGEYILSTNYQTFDLIIDLTGIDSGLFDIAISFSDLDSDVLDRSVYLKGIEIYELLDFYTLEKTSPSISVEATDITYTSIGFAIDITDIDSVGEISAIDLYQGEELIQSLSDLNVREFVDLLSNNVYSIKVEYTYDLNDGLGSQTIFEYALIQGPPIDAYTVSEVVLGHIGEGTVYGEVIEAYFNPGEGVGHVSITDGFQTFSFATWSGVEDFHIGDIVIVDFYYEEINLMTMSMDFGPLPFIPEILTLRYIEPSVELTSFTSSKDSISFSLLETDVDEVGEIISLQLFQGETLIQSLSYLNERVFGDLLSDNQYRLIITYQYNLNDGLGDQTIIIESDVSTLPLSTPNFVVYNKVVDYDSISFNLFVSDPDEINAIDKIELYEDSDLIETYLDSGISSFDNLYSGREYSIIIYFHYDLNDGNGIINDTFIINAETMTYSIPIIDINYVNFSLSVMQIGFIVRDANNIMVLDSAILYEDANVIESLPNLMTTNIYGLNVANAYQLVIEYHYDLNDGFGEVAAVQEFEISYQQFLEEAVEEIDIDLNVDEMDILQIPVLSGRAMVDWEVVSGSASINGDIITYEFVGSDSVVELLATLTIERPDGVIIETTESFIVNVSAIDIIDDFSVIEDKSETALYESGDYVYVKGIITSIVDSGIYIQDINGNGLLLYHGEHYNDGTLHTGDEVVYYGPISYYYELVEVLMPNLMQVVSTGNSFTFNSYSASELVNADFTICGDLIYTSGLRIDDYDNTYVWFVVEDGLGNHITLRYAYIDYYPDFFTTYSVGDTINNVSFVVYLKNQTNYRIEDLVIH